MDNQRPEAPLTYVMSAVATPMMIDPRPKTKARISLVETVAKLNYEDAAGNNIKLTHCSVILLEGCLKLEKERELRKNMGVLRCR